MNLLPFIVLCLAALSAFLVWVDAAPRKFASGQFALFLFIVGVTLAFVVSGDPLVNIEMGT